MISLKIIQVESSEVPAHPQHARTTVLDEPIPGFFRQIQLADTGLYVRCGDDVVFLELAEILSAAEKANPNMMPPVAKEK